MYASSYLLAAGIFLCSSPVERCECSTEICLLERNSSNGSAPASTAVLLSFGPASNSCELQATIEVVSNASTSNCSQQSPSIEESSSTSTSDGKIVKFLIALTAIYGLLLLVLVVAVSVFGLVLFKKHTTIKAFDFVNRRASTGVNEAYGILEDGAPEREKMNRYETEEDTLYCNPDYNRVEPAGTEAGNQRLSTAHLLPDSGSSLLPPTGSSTNANDEDPDYSYTHLRFPDLKPGKEGETLMEKPEPGDTKTELMKDDMGGGANIGVNAAYTAVAGEKIKVRKKIEEEPTLSVVVPAVSPVAAKQLKKDSKSTQPADSGLGAGPVDGGKAEHLLKSRVSALTQGFESLQSATEKEEGKKEGKTNKP